MPNEPKISQFRTRFGTKQGSKHINLGTNNQDAREIQSFSIPTSGKTFHVGLVSDGCTGNPLFSHNEVGANLLILYAYRRIQELICSSVPIGEIPKALFPSCTEFLLNLTGWVIPPTIVWQYPAPIKDREEWSSQKRFRTDFLAATLLGFITDEQDLVTFSAGDGIILVNDDIEVIDQDDKPEYPAISINQPGKGFVTKHHRMDTVRRVAVMTDGLESLMKDPTFVDRMFRDKLDTPLGLQFVLNLAFKANPELMKDDCTAVTLEKIET